MWDFGTCWNEGIDILCCRPTKEIGNILKSSLEVCGKMKLKS